MALDEFLPVSGLGLHIHPYGLVCLFGEAFLSNPGLPAEDTGTLDAQGCRGGGGPPAEWRQVGDTWPRPAHSDTDVSLRIPANPQILSSLWVPGAGPSGE